MRNPLRSLFDIETRGIGNSHELLSYLMRGSESTAGATVNEQSALNIAAVMTCVSLISRTIATLPLGIYERGEDGRSKHRAKRHPLKSIVDTPNSWQTRAEFVQMMQTHLLLRGNAYAWINRSSVVDGVVRELIPLHPDRVRVEQKPDWRLVYTLELTSGREIELPTHEVLHLRGLSTDGIVGRSALADARELFGSAIATQDYTSNFWKRDATPSVVLSHPKTLSEKARTGLRDQWEATYAGKGARRVAVLEEGMSIERLTMTAEDAQFLETRKFQRGEIAGWFHVPPHMIGDTEKTTSWGTGVEQQQIGFETFTIRPWLVVWEQRLNRDLITSDRYFMEFNLAGLRRGDMQARKEYFSAMLDRGVFSINDVREIETLNPVEGGDTRLVARNMVPLDQVDAIIEAETAQPDPAPGEETTE